MRYQLTSANYNQTNQKLLYFLYFRGKERYSTKPDSVQLISLSKQVGFPVRLLPETRLGTMSDQSLFKPMPLRGTALLRAASRESPGPAFRRALTRPRHGATLYRAKPYLPRGMVLYTDILWHQKTPVLALQESVDFPTVLCH